MNTHPLFENLARLQRKRGQLREAGDSLTRFNASGDGMYLFQAFAHWFDATEADRKARNDEIQAEMGNPAGMPPQDFEAATTELLMFNILERLRPVIADLHEFCGATLDDNAKLTALRDALRIGKFHAPSDSATREAKRRCIAAWISEYGTLERGAAYSTETAIARSVGKSCGISYKTALAYWHRFLKDEPWQAQYVQQLVDRVNSKNRRKNQKPKAARKKPIKPSSWR